MRFRIVEVKSNDLFTIYDADNGGVCCCSRYTILQLINEFKQDIDGVSIDSKGRLSVTEVGLDGTARSKKAPTICTDITKRSATTIIKGLDEKHYPRVKQERRSAGSYVELTYVLNRSEYTRKAIQTAPAAYVTTDGCVINSTQQNVKITTVSVCTPSDDDKQLLDTLYTMVQQQQAIKAKVQSDCNVIDKQAAKLDAEIAKLTQGLMRLKQQKDKVISAGKHEVQEQQNQMQKTASVFKCRNLRGDERVKYSFHAPSRDADDVTRDYIRTVVERTNRTIRYTHGLSYRNPTTNKKPISKEQALKIIDAEGFLEVDATDPKVVYLQTYSANDMW